MFGFWGEVDLPEVRKACGMTDFTKVAKDYPQEEVLEEARDQTDSQALLAPDVSGELAAEVFFVELGLLGVVYSP
jgi:hypothetical protein